MFFIKKHNKDFFKSIFNFNKTKIQIENNDSKTLNQIIYLLSFNKWNRYKNLNIDHIDFFSCLRVWMWKKSSIENFVLTRIW